jgi:hypothetical protein
MQLVFGEARGNLAEAKRLYTESFLNRRTPNHFEHRL